MLEGYALEGLYQEYKDRGGKFLTVAMDSNHATILEGRPLPAECRHWADSPDPYPDLTFPCVADSYSETGGQQAWPHYWRHGWLIPTTVILDRGLRVVESIVGYSPVPFEFSVRENLDALVGTTDECLH